MIDVVTVMLMMINAGRSQHIEVPNCSLAGQTYVNGFRLDDNSSLAIQQTFVGLCYTDEGIQFIPNCADDNIQSPYTQCNQDLFNADVFEVFLSSDSTDEAPTYYLEVELSPHGVLFVTYVVNPNGVCNGIEDTLVDCGQSGIIYNATINSQGWNGYLLIPFNLIDKASRVSPPTPIKPGSQFRINMFRIDTPLGSYKEYSAWHPTDESPPCFHVPSKFGYLTLFCDCWFADRSSKKFFTLLILLKLLTHPSYSTSV
ncbi:hypothetical protein DFA_11379 [Cavenderia fasciculata]|uniref:Carbohydrate-binding domain-containing protein n=1 Tax=Cavenderia fasciculata TaxID=261658 RepID=F4QCN6_CACFS|nr:uncharacterized protein DFA_11379 [Cavenderia fasciculata]EGG13618.1 hypothetical protein DFA_11379 [Cavenderia fasciculata]|eukprot:XP_004350322.1 hypothetical protein DFA_11379 [Cavenderia fasciculata]